MGKIIFKNGIYKSKSKKESEILSASLNNGILYKIESIEEVEKKFNERVKKPQDEKQTSR